MGAIGARPDINNPGDLTVTGPNSLLYPGQTGVYASPNGNYYAKFDDPQSGTNALLDYIQRHAVPGMSSSDFASFFLNGSTGPVTNTPDNPHATTWLSAIDNALGLRPGDPITSRNPSDIGAAIAQAEGTASVYADPNNPSYTGSTEGSNAKTTSGGFLGGLGSLINAAVSIFQRGFAERATATILGGVLILLAIAAMIFSPQINAVAGGAVKAVKGAV